MKKYFLLLGCFIIILFSCNEQKKQDPVTKEIATDSRPPVTAATNMIKNCYSKITGKDTVKLSFTIDNDVIGGDLSYNYFEKDKNTGTISGKFSGDTLIAEYTFRSEGMISVREVAFLVNENTLTEGFGESEDQNGKMVLKRSGLKFDKSGVLNKVECE